MQSSDLFSHMNQDNLNYIKQQLKSKRLSKELQPTVPVRILAVPSAPPVLSDSKIMTQNPSGELDLNGPKQSLEIPSIEPNEMLTPPSPDRYFQQSQSLRISSKQDESHQFIYFLDQYVRDLKTNDSLIRSSIQQNRKHHKSSTRGWGVTTIQEQLKKQKLSSYVLTQEIEKGRNREQKQLQIINKLQDDVNYLKNQMYAIKKLLKTEHYQLWGINNHNQKLPSRSIYEHQSQILATQRSQKYPKYHW